MTVASIDIGSNTVLMLIAKIDFSRGIITPVGNYFSTPRIGKDVVRDGRIKEDKISLLISTLDEYLKIIQKQNCQKIFIKATNAFRIARNGKEIAGMLSRRFGWDVEIIDGIEEARLSFLGTAFPFHDADDKIVIDIGGGSTEIIKGRNDLIDYRKSFAIGVVNLKDKFLPGDKPEKENITEIERFAENSFAELSSYIKEPFSTIAVAGTPTTLSCIKQNLKNYSENLVENSSLTIAEIDQITNRIMSMKNDEIRMEFGPVVEGREDVLLSGCIILISVMKKIGLQTVTVSTKGLRYGPVVDFLLKSS